MTCERNNAILCVTKNANIEKANNKKRRKKFPAVYSEYDLEDYKIVPNAER